MSGLSVGRASLVLIAGLWLGYRTGISGVIWLPAGILLFVLWLVLRRKSAGFITDQPVCKAARLTLCASIICFALFRTTFPNTEKGPRHADSFIGSEPTTFYATVIRPPKQSSNRLTVRVSVDALQEDAKGPNEGNVEVILLRNPQLWADRIRYGTRLQLSGRLSLPADASGRFSYRKYLEREGVGCVMYSPTVSIRSGNGGNPLLKRIFDLREKLVGRVMELFPDPENALLAGILLGDETHISTTVENEFNTTGTSHIIAISGANFSLICMVLLSIVRRLVPVWWAPLILLPFVAFYTILVGGNAAVVRAAVMCGLTMAGICIDRTDSRLSLIKASALMLLWDPAYFEDLGFQLSVGATLGILLFADPLKERIGKRLSAVESLTEKQRGQILDILSDLILTSVSAQAITVWISASAFGRISLISLPANFLIAPFQPFIMLGGFTALLADLLFSPLGKAAAFIVYPAPALTIRLVSLCAKSSFGMQYTELSPAVAWGIIALIVLIRLRWRDLFADLRQKIPVSVTVISAFLAAALWSVVFARNDSRLRLSLSSAGNRFAFTAVTPHQHRIIIAGGQTSFGAGDLMGRNVFTEDPADAVLIDFSEDWMKKYFLASGKADDTPLLLLDDHSALGPGASLEIDGLVLTDLAEMFGHRCWLAEYGDIRVLFPLGVSRDRIPEEPLGDRLLVILSAQDDPAEWTGPRFPNVYESRGSEKLSLISDGKEIFLSELHADS